jgi:hypothetical protein
MKLRSWKSSATAIKVVGMGIAGHELAKRKAFVTADVLDTELTAFLPDWISQLLIVEPPAAGRPRIEGIKFQSGNLVLLDVHLETVECDTEPLVRRQATC